MILPSRSPRVAPWRRPGCESGDAAGPRSAIAATGLPAAVSGETPGCPVSLNAALKPKILLRGRWQPPQLLQWTRKLLPPLPRPSLLSGAARRESESLAFHTCRSARHDQTPSQPLRPMGPADADEDRARGDSRQAGRGAGACAQMGQDQATTQRSQRAAKSREELSPGRECS